MQGQSNSLGTDVCGVVHTSLSILSYIQIFTLAESLGGYDSLAELP